MEKIKPNYNFFLLITLCASLVLMFASHLIGTSNQLQKITLILAPFFLTYIFKNKYESSPYGYFISENEIIYKDKRNEITTHLNDVKLKKRFFSQILVLNGGKIIELSFYDKKSFEKHLDHTKLI